MIRPRLHANDPESTARALQDPDARLSDPDDLDAEIQIATISERLRRAYDAEAARLRTVRGGLSDGSGMP